jgi:hypothetical protein
MCDRIKFQLKFQRHLSLDVCNRVRHTRRKKVGDSCEMNDNISPCPHVTNIVVGSCELERRRHESRPQCLKTQFSRFLGTPLTRTRMKFRTFYKFYKITICASCGRQAVTPYNTFRGYFHDVRNLRQTAALQMNWKTTWKWPCPISDTITTFEEPGYRSWYCDWLRAGRPRGRSSSPSRVKNFLHVVQIGSGTT